MEAKEKNWISVNDRLPEVGSQVRVKTSRGKVFDVCFVTTYASGKICFLTPTLDTSDYVTHWQPQSKND